MTSEETVMDKDNSAEIETKPWWRYPLMWMVLGGPFVVVVASLVTLWIVVHNPDPVVAEDYYRQGIEINRTLAGKKLMPALEGRNHAMIPAEE
jgi:hypothetical protein